eukprot:m.113312 g.113312  ORF g.113312 m.113312 type:complete len:2350 (-) comp15356_c3_seq1:622-7671(-)
MHQRSKMLLITLAVICSLFSSSFADYNTWIKFDRSQYYITSTTYAGSDTGNAVCKSIDPTSYLVHVSTEQESNFITEQLKGVGSGERRVHIGQVKTSDGYRTFSDNPSAPLYWTSRYQQLSSPCVRLKVGFFFVWYSIYEAISCSDRLNLICERPYVIPPLSFSRGIFDYYFGGLQASFSESAQACTQWRSGAQLATLDSLNEQVDLLARIAAEADLEDTDYIYFGLQRSGDDQPFTYLDGTPFDQSSFSNWLNQPANGAHCATLQRSGTAYKWVAVQCSSENLSICRVQRENCNPSTYRDIISNTCQDCRSGAFSSQPNQLSCDSWSICDGQNRGLNEDAAPPSSSTDRSCRDCVTSEIQTLVTGVFECICLLGSEPERDQNGDRLCQACAPGTFQQTRGTACQSCPPNTYQDQAGQTFCLPPAICQPGSYITSNLTAQSNRHCQACTLGTSFSTTTNSYNCTLATVCQIGEEETTAPTLTSDRVCTQCIVGVTYYNAATKKCTPVSTCPEGAYAAQSATLTSDVVCQPASYTCDNDVRLDDMSSCSCSVISNACAVCDRDPGLEAQLGSVLLMLNELPQDPIILQVFFFDDTVSDEVDFCNTKCYDARGAGCIGFTLVYSGEQTGTCNLLTSYRSDARFPAPNARFYSLSRCRVCDSGYAIDGLSCTAISEPPVFAAASQVALIPLNLPIGTVVANVMATSTAPAGQDTIMYSLSASSTTFSVNPSTGAVVLVKALQTPVSVTLTIIASDSRTECTSLVNRQLTKTPGPCTSTTQVTVSVAALLGCPRDINEYIDPGQDSKIVDWGTPPRFPSSAPNMTLELYMDGTSISATTTMVDVPVGKTVFTYKSRERLSIGEQLECTFTVSVRNGFFISVDNIDVRTSDTTAHAYVLSSPGIADAARLVPFTSDLTTTFFIGFRSTSGRPFTISVPENMQADVQIDLKWCTDSLPFPSDFTQGIATNVSIVVDMAGANAASDIPEFSDSGSFIYDNTNTNRRCLQMLSRTNSFNGSLEFSTIELEFSPPSSSGMRRRSADDRFFLPSFPSFIVVEMQTTDGSPAAATSLEGAVTTDDLVPPQFLECPPPASARTFTVGAGQVAAVVTLPEMSAFDSVDKAPQIIYPFTTASLSVIDSPHTVSVIARDSSNNEQTCAFDVLVLAEEHVLERTEVVTEWEFPGSRQAISALRVAYFTHQIYSSGGEISRFEVDLSQLTELRFSFSSPSSEVPFVVRERSASRGGRLVVDMSWLADGVTNIGLFGQQENVRAYLELSDLVIIDNHGNITNSEEMAVFELDDQEVAADIDNGLVAVRGKSVSFAQPFTFTQVSVVIRFIGVSGMRGNTNWTISSSSFVGVEYEYVYSPENDSPKASEVLGFLSLRDQSPPFFSSCPRSISRRAFDGRELARVSWQEPQASDNRAVVSLESNVASGTQFYLLEPGTPPLQVKYVAKDAFDNKATCTFTVTIRDEEAPVLSSGRVFTVALPATKAEVVVSDTNWLPLSVEDNAQPLGAWAVPQLVWHNATSTYGVGVHVVGMRYADAYGNTAETYSIINVTDVTPPVVTCPPDIERVTEVDVPGRAVTWTLNNGTDNSGLAVSMQLSNASGTFFPIGVHTVTVTGTDHAGLVSSCDFTVKVVGVFSPPPTPPPPVVNGTAAPLIPQASQSLNPGVLGGAGGGFVVAVMVGVMLFVRHARRKNRAPQNWEDIFKLMDQFKDSEDGPRYPREVNRAALKLLGELGKGAFGIVYKGMLKEHASIPGYLVAVKSLHNNDSLADRQELLEEAAVMAQFESPHVVELVGVITVGKPVYVITEFMEHGSLKSYLENNDIALETQVLWAGDCCEGLAHVHSKGFIHRDVAARNVLISSELRCKISDFGLAREIEEDDTYYKSRGGQLPVRWTAIEALEDRKFNEKTDVWSCGVLIHEIWTRAELPYKGWSNQKVWVEVAAGYRLSQPDKCRDDVYAMMRECWAEEQTDRPTFIQLADFFRTLYTELTGEDLRQESYLQVGSDVSDTETMKSGGLGNFFRRLSGAHLTNRVYAGNKSFMGKSGSIAELRQADSGDLYDMGEEDATAQLPARRDTQGGTPEGADLYDMGEDDAAAKLPAKRNVESNRMETDDLYDMGDDIPLKAVSKSKRGSQLSVLSMSSRAESSSDIRVSAADIGCRVRVEAYSCDGTLRFFGKHHVKGILRCGVELDEPIGLNNGTVSGHTYFTCPDKHGVLCNPSKVTVLETDTEFGFAETEFETINEAEPQEDFSQDLYGNMDTDAGQGPSDDRQYGQVGAKDVGKRVKVQGYTCPGTLRFFGKHNETGEMRCGVELDEAQGKNNGTVKGFEYFVCKENHGVLCSPSKVTMLE